MRTAGGQYDNSVDLDEPVATQTYHALYEIIQASTCVMLAAESMVNQG